MGSGPAPGVPLTVFDTSPIVAGSTARAALHHSVDLARHAEDLGFHRYWVAEHHGMPGVASCATAVLIGRIAAATARIRVGSGAVLLPNHAPLVLAEEFGTLEAFHPGRIDLGLGRASGGRRDVVEHVRGAAERAATGYPEQIAGLLRHFEPDAVHDRVRAVPATGNRPAVWLLGSSTASAELAGSFGLPYAFGMHLRPRNAPDALAAYRGAFRPSVHCPRPRVLVSVPVIAADDDARAHHLAGPARLKALRRSQGTPVLLPSPDEAAAYPYSGDDRALLDERFAHHVIGSPDTVTDRLRAVLDETAADELAVQLPIFDHDDRRHACALVAGVGERLTRVRAAGPG